ncbi:MAG: actinin-like protein [Benniella sp.]|nr:MAG: actinin-like protein [Benniella sp.]
MNIKLNSGNHPEIKDLLEISNGIPLIRLLEVIGDHKFRYQQSMLRFVKVQNMNMCLEFIRSRQVTLTNIGAEDIVDGNLKLILGLIWTLILRFTIADINQEGRSAKEGLLLWCQRKTAGYQEVRVRDFTTSWTDGLAFCALIHRHRPDLLDYHALDKSWESRHYNTQLAFDIAAEHLNIPKLLDVEDVCDVSKPDERSVMTYVAQYFHAFSELGKADTARRRVAKFAEVMESIWTMQSDYERRVQALMLAIENRKKAWITSTFRGDYADAKRQSTEFVNYKTSLKRTWVAEKRAVSALLGNIQTKLRTYDLKPYHPPPGLTLQDLDDFWKDLLDAEEQRYRKINEQIRMIKDFLRKSFASQANAFQAELNAISNELTALDGDLHHQLDYVRVLNSRLGPLADTLELIQQLEDQCIEANIEENDETIYSADDLSFDFGLLEQAIHKKSAFISNQIVSSSMTNLTPAQLEEFESTFRHFDGNQTNMLTAIEFKAALASLGIEYDDAEFEGVFVKCSQGEMDVSFEQFIHFMVGVTEDRASGDQVRESFHIIAGDKPFVTELDLKQACFPPAVVSYLQSSMPHHTQDGYDYIAYLDSVFN